MRSEMARSIETIGSFLRQILSTEAEALVLDLNPEKY